MIEKEENPPVSPFAKGGLEHLVVRERTENERTVAMPEVEFPPLWKRGDRGDFGESL
jgi:hypothetical protein